MRCRTVVLPSFVDTWDLQFGFEWNNSGTPCDGRDILIDLLVLKCRKGPDQDCRRFQTLCSLSFKKCDWWQTCLACLACSSGKPLLSNLPCRRSAPATAARASSNKIMRICANHRYLVCFCCSQDSFCMILIAKFCWAGWTMGRCGGLSDQKAAFTDVKVPPHNGPKDGYSCKRLPKCNMAIHFLLSEMGFWFSHMTWGFLSCGPIKILACRVQT